MHALNEASNKVRCAECDAVLQERDRFCPWCGAPGPAASGKTRSAAPTGTQRVHDGGWTKTTAALAATLAGLLIVALIGMAGVYFGLRDRAAIERQAAADHLARGAAYLESGDLELAAAELELAVRLAPDLAEAATLLDEARMRVAAIPTVTVEPEPQQQSPVPALFDDLVAAHARGDWEWVWELAGRIRSLDAGYRANDVAVMLFDAFYQSGLDLVEQDRLPEAVRLFDRALEVSPGDVAATEARQLAGDYMDGLARWGADWPGAIAKLRAVFVRDPEYRDTREKLHGALEAYGDSLAAKGEWCSAQQQYAAALEIMDSTLVTTKHSEVRQRCAAGEGPIEATPGATAAPGTFVGRVVEETGVGEDRIMIRGLVVDASGRGIQGVRVRIAAFDWSSTAITDGSGTFAFDGLSNPVTYTVSLPERTSEPLEVPGVLGTLTWIEFRRVGS